MRGLALLLLCALHPSCVVTADESLWRARVEGGPREARGQDRSVHELAVDARRELGLDAPRKPDQRQQDGIAPRPDLSCGQLSLTVTAAPDDGFIHHAFYPNGDPDYHFNWTGFWSGVAEWDYFRFTLQQALPAGTTISSATLSLWGKAADQWTGSAALDVFVEDSKDAAAVTGTQDAPLVAGGRAVTTMLRWPASGGLTWAIEGYNTTPNLASLLQTVIDGKGGLAAGAHVQLWLRGAQSIDADLATLDYATPGYSATPHKLQIGYCK